MSVKTCSSVDGHHVFGTNWGFGGLDVVLPSPQRLVLPSTGTTSSGQSGASAGWSWCFPPRKSLFLRRRAPRLRDKIGFRPAGRGASLPATPYSFVVGHHVFGTIGGFGRLVVVLPSPQNLVPSSGGTTPLGQNGASAGWSWCFPPRNALFFRRQAPRLWSKIGLRPIGRGASLPAKPCSSVVRHHVFETKWGFDRLNVVLRSPQRLVSSSSGTTSLGLNRASAGWTWCFTPRNVLFFRRRAPRLWNKIGFRPVGRGASLPATPCSSVDGHHVSMRT